MTLHDKKEIEKLKNFKKQFLKQKEKEKGLSFEEKIKLYLKGWRE